MARKSDSFLRQKVVSWKWRKWTLATCVLSLPRHLQVPRPCPIISYSPQTEFKKESCAQCNILSFSHWGETANVCTLHLLCQNNTLQLEILLLESRYDKPFTLCLGLNLEITPFLWPPNWVNHRVQPDWRTLTDKIRSIDDRERVPLWINLSSGKNP